MSPSGKDSWFWGDSTTVSRMQSHLWELNIQSSLTEAKHTTAKSLSSIVFVQTQKRLQGMKQALGAGIGWKAGRKMSLWGPRPCVSVSIPQATVQMPQRSHRSLHRCPTGASVGVKSTVRTAVGRWCTKAHGREYESGLKCNGPFPFKKKRVFMYLFIWMCPVFMVACGTEPGRPALGAWTLSYWTTREVQLGLFWQWRKSA